MTLADVVYDVHGMSDALVQSWSRFGTGIEGSPCMHGDRLLQLREEVDRRPFASEARIIALADTVSAEEDRWRALEELKSSLRKRGSKRAKQKDEDRAMWQKFSGGAESVKPPTYAETKKEIEKVVEQIKELKKQRAVAGTADDGQPLPGRSSNAEPTSSPSRVGTRLNNARAPISSVRVGRSASSKLNYILQEVNFTHTVICNSRKLTC
jgi:hypothetical protein